MCVPKLELGDENEKQRRGAPVGVPSRGDTQVPPYENWALVANRSYMRANQPLIANPRKIRAGGGSPCPNITPKRSAPIVFAVKIHPEGRCAHHPYKEFHDCGWPQTAIVV